MSKVDKRLCPCGSNIIYKKCCKPLHKGLYARNALSLMRSRYSAYALKEINYIIATTHPDNEQYQEHKQKWKSELREYCNSVSFDGLKIIEFVDGEKEAIVEFVAIIDAKEYQERSIFKKEKRWLYYGVE